MPFGPSSTTVSDIENGDAAALAAKTFRKLDESLQWEDGSAKRAFDGGDPIPLENRAALDLQDVPIDSLLAEIRRRVVEPSPSEILGPIGTLGNKPKRRWASG